MKTANNKSSSLRKVIARKGAKIVFEKRAGLNHVIVRDDADVMAMP